MKQFDIKNVYIEWREMKKLTVKESTMATYTSNAEKHILPAFGSVSSIDETQMQDFVLKLSDSGLSPRTVKDIFLVLKMLLEFGRKRGLAEWRDCDVKMPQCAASTKVTVLTHAQQKALMGHLRRHFSFRGLGLYICLCTGMRIGEVRAEMGRHRHTLAANQGGAHHRAHIHRRRYGTAHEGGDRQA